MPSTGRPMSYNAASHFGAPASDTLFGPPDRMMPMGLRARIFSIGASGGHTSEYTDSSRRRRAISCVYCEPKSRTMIVSCSTSGFGVQEWGLGTVGIRLTSVVTHPESQLRIPTVNSIITSVDHKML